MSKAYKILGLLRRTFNSFTPTGVCKTLYLSLVRSQLTYCCSVWRPHLLKERLLLEKVQCCATKWILNDNRSDYRTRLISLHMLPLMMVYELCDITLSFLSLYLLHQMPLIFATISPLVPPQLVHLDINFNIILLALTLHVTYIYKL